MIKRMLGFCTVILGCGGFLSVYSIEAEGSNNLLTAPNPDSQRAVADSLHAVGDSLREKQNYSQAIEILQQEVELRREIPDSQGELKAFNLIGRAFNGLSESDSALAYANQVLAIADITRDSAEIAQAYHTKGYAYNALERYEEAISEYKLAVDIRLAYGDSVGAARSLNNIGNVYWNLHDYERTFENVEKALEIKLKALGPDHPYVAMSYAYIGVAYNNYHNHQQALENYKKALEIWMKVLGAEHPDMAEHYEMIGLFYNNASFYQQALESHKKSLKIRLKALGPEHPNVATTYANIGSVYRVLGEYQRALENYKEALGIRLKALGPEHPNVAVAMNYAHIGDIYQDLGEYPLALEYFNKALEINLEVWGAESFAVAMNYAYIGNIYQNLGEYPLALEYFKKALEIRQKVFGLEDNAVSWSYSDIGWVYYDLGEYQQALEYFEKSLKIQLKVYTAESQRHMISGYANIGWLYSILGFYEQALGNMEKALEIDLKTFGHGHAIVAYDYNYIGSVCFNLGDYEQALEYMKEALEIRLKVLGPEHPVVATSYNDIGGVYRAQDQSDSALVYFEKSIDLFEKSRGKIESEELRKSYTETVSERYEAIISLLMEMGRPEEAFEYLERSKSKSLKDALNDKYDIDFGAGTMSEKLEESKRLAWKADALEGQLIEEKQKPDSLQNVLKVENLSRLLAETKAEYLKVAAEIRTDPDYAFTVQVHPTDLGAISNDLPDEQKLLMFYSGEAELYLFLVSNQGYEVRSVPVSRDSLNNLIDSCRSLCSSGKTKQLANDGKLFDWNWVNDGSEFYAKEVLPLKKVLSELYAYLIEPLEEELSTCEIVTFIPSGQLYYLPWGALLADSDSLIFLSERYNWNVLTSTELLGCIYRRQGRQKRLKSLALVGNPTGANLVSAETEVTSIGQTYRNTTTLIGNQATEPQVIQITPGAQALHLATHCILKSDRPLDSYIQLAATDSSDGHWTITEVWGESWDKMQLVTLSACETALGGNQPGLEFVSMAKAFSLAMEGPPAIVATLWSVEDNSTKELMVTFYEELKRNPKSEALRLAQQKLIYSEQYAHPFFWAPFILIGEWR